MRLLLVVSLALLAMLQYRLWSGEKSLQMNARLEAQIERQIEGNKQLKERNDVLQKEIDDLRYGLDAAEERARHELGMIRENEQFYRVVRQTQP